MLRAAEAALEQARAAAPGVDGLPWQDYETDLDRRVEDLHSRVYRGAYRTAVPTPAYTESGRKAAPTRGGRASSTMRWMR